MNKKDIKAYVKFQGIMLVDMIQYLGYLAITLLPAAVIVFGIGWIIQALAN